MPPTPEHSDTLCRLLTRLSDGTLDADGYAHLDALLAESSEAQDVYLDHLTHEALLHREYAEPEPQAAVRPASARGTHSPRIAPTTYALAAALALGAAVVAIYVFVFSADRTSNIENRPSSSPVATLIETTGGGTLLVDDDIARPGSEYASGDYALDTGSAQFLLTNRVTVDLSGPTQLSVHDPMSVYLARGRASFNVPAEAVGFTVHLPDRSLILDLGTAFRVEVDDADRATVRVTEGHVAWTRPDADSVVLGAGQVARLVDGRVLAEPAPTLIAYHDFGGEPSPGHITTQRSLKQTVELVDHFDGSQTGIELTVTGANGMDDRTDTTRSPAPGTPADELFGHTEIDLDDGLINVGGNNPSRRMTITLTGLDPTQRYDLALYGDRATDADGPERFTLTGADDATNASSAGVIDAITTSLETRPNAKLGHVVRWTGIDPGDDGSVEVQVQITGTNLAYLSALRLAASDNDSTNKPENNSPEKNTLEGDTP